MSPAQQKPLNERQKRFGRELGLALAAGERLEDAYEKAGFRRHRGNAYRLASDPRIQKIADDVAEEALKLNGLHLAYLQAKMLKMFQMNASHTLFERVRGRLRVKDLTDEKVVPFDASWAVTKFKFDGETGELTDIEVPDKNTIFNTLIKTMPKALAPTRFQDVTDDLEGIDDPEELRRRLIARATAIGANDVASALAKPVGVLIEG